MCLTTRELTQIAAPVEELAGLVRERRHSSAVVKEILDGVPQEQVAPVSLIREKLPLFV